MTDTPPTTPIDDLAAWVQAYKDADNNAKDWKATADRAKEHITARLAEHGADAGTVGGHVVVTNNPVESTRFDTKKFREQYPELADQFTVPTCTRRFTLTRRA